MRVLMGVGQACSWPGREKDCEGLTPCHEGSDANTELESLEVKVTAWQSAQALRSSGSVSTPL
jgi:hypothetical protein